MPSSGSEMVVFSGSDAFDSRRQQSWKGTVVDMRTVLPTLRAANGPAIRPQVLHCTREPDAFIRTVVQENSADLILVPSVEELFLQTRPGTWGCAIIDYPAYGSEGFEELEKQATNRPGLPWIVRSSEVEWSAAVEAMKRGALDVVPHDATALSKALAVGLETGRQRLLQWSQAAEVQRRFAELSESEKQVLALVMQGRTNKEIALDLDFSLRTVESRRHRILRVMQAENAIQLAVLLTNCGLLNSSKVAESGILTGPHWTHS